MHHSIFVCSWNQSPCRVFCDAKLFRSKFQPKQWKSSRGRLHAQPILEWKRHAFHQTTQHIFNTSVERWWWRRRRAIDSLALAFGTKIIQRVSHTSRKFVLRMASMQTRKLSTYCLLRRTNGLPSAKLKPKRIVNNMLRFLLAISYIPYIVTANALKYEKSNACSVCVQEPNYRNMLWHVLCCCRRSTAYSNLKWINFEFRFSVD